MLKLHCNKCHEFIQEISPDQARHFSGNEICKNCEEFARKNIQKVNELYSKIRSDIDARHNKAVAQMEELVRNVFSD